MSAIGGFLPLEHAASGARPYHSDMLELGSGRAALALVLSHVRARRLHLPFFICDSVLDAVRAAGAEPLFYPLDSDLLPARELAPGPDDLLLLVDFFGIRSARIAAMAQAYRERCVVDNTQAFFQTPVPGSWTYYSARKFFGVPDGAYLSGPETLDATRLPETKSSITHLEGRATRNPAALEMFRQREREIDCVPRRMSPVSRELLASLDYPGAAARRMQNARHLHERLAGRNLLANPIGKEGTAPLCYPLLLETPIARDVLAARGLFVPTFWNEVLTRPGSEGFQGEQRMAAHLLPLPLDHRYGLREMQILVDRLLPLLPSAR